MHQQKAGLFGWELTLETFEAVDDVGQDGGDRGRIGEQRDNLLSFQPSLSW